MSPPLEESAPSILAPSAADPVRALLLQCYQKNPIDMGDALTQVGKQFPDIDADDMANEIFHAQEITPAMSAGDEFPRITLARLSAHVVNKGDHIAGDGWIKRGGGTLFVGGTGDGKSVCVEQASVCLAAGVPILNRIPVHSPCRVLHVQAENDIETLQRDVLSIFNNIPGHPCPVLVQANLCLHHVYGLTGDDLAAWLEKRVSTDRPDVIVIDPYQAYIGGHDINNSETFLNWIRPIETIIKKYRCALILVAHTPKPRDRDNWTQRESVYMAAGSSVISNWARTSAELTQAGDDGRYRLRFGKNAERTGMVDTQGRLVRDLFIEHSGRRAEPFWKVCDNQAVVTTGKHDADIRAALRDNPAGSDAEIAKAIGCNRSTVYRFRQKSNQ